LKFRITNGYNANSNNNVSAVVTQVYSSSLSQWGAPLASLQNPPNPNLRWEKINMLNIALDFGLRNEIITGSIEYYHKRGTDILGNGPIAPQSGLSQFFGNIADTKGNGIDLTINSKNISSKNFQWSSNFVFSYVSDIVTNYKIKPSTIGTYVTNINSTPATLTPVEGYPLYSIFSYPWAGLDQTGKPQTYLDGKLSTNYSALSSSSNYSNLHYNGSAIPQFFGSLRNTFSYKQFSISANITSKLNYWFRNFYVSRSSVVMSTRSIVNQDYQQRWQKPGDETKTNVPAMIYPVSSNAADFIYANSDVTALKGDHVRLQDIQFNYDLQRKRVGNITIPAMRIYIYLNNLGIIWRANDKKIDPDATSVSSMPNAKTYSFGVKFEF